MALSSALFSGVSGLGINQKMLDVVGNNLANSNTSAFKGQTVGFQDLIYQTLSQGSASTATTGGTNPQQVGYGAQQGALATNFAQGPLQNTGRDLDLAIQGKGFFVVNDGTKNLYTRSGGFELDGNGYIVDASSGFRVQRTGTVGELSATSPAFQVTGDNSIKIPLGFGLAGIPTSNITMRGNLSAGAAVGAKVSTAIQVFDTQGTEHALSLTFTKTGPNAFSLDGTLNGGTITGLPTAAGAITFNANGTLANPATLPLTVAFPAGGLPAAQPVVLQLGTVGQGNGLTQFGGDNTAAAINQDGSRSGILDSFTVDSGGTFQGVFTNGRILPLGQLGLASFPNEGGLVRSGKSLFTLSNSSGTPTINAANSLGRGSVQASALEGSNVDVSSEFTRLIIAQRGFQINARTVTASNDVLQELANIVR